MVGGMRIGLAEEKKKLEQLARENNQSIEDVLNDLHKPEWLGWIIRGVPRRPTFKYNHAMAD
ncbi:hypothetical protein D3871_08610 [Noviherbaspirillum saxi]|uniref:Uncharacterized protein n=1 Tax=Noviherbaspirillum saxi TaxID=2320863 RepID=A0A3A3FQR8_9BURK|nr:hypothetical protein D3871_08610 [Noviherbaspirillum saxi]